MVTLKSLHIYPIKSAQGLDVDTVRLDRFGAEGDRRWMITDDAGVFVTQRDLPLLSALEVQINPTGLRLSRGSKALEVERPAGVARLVTVWGDQVDAIDAGDAAAHWLSEQFGEALRLVYMPETSNRLVDPDFAKEGETVSFADGFPLLLVSEASEAHLNKRLQHPVTLARFRPNLVISGCPPHAEDGWRRIRIGAVEFTVAKPCSRCVMPSYDQRTGEKHPELLRILASYRRGEGGKVYFGQNLLYQGGGSLHIGDQVEVLE